MIEKVKFIWLIYFRLSLFSVFLYFGAWCVTSLDLSIAKTNIIVSFLNFGKTEAAEVLLSPLVIYITFWMLYFIGLHLISTVRSTKNALVHGEGKKCPKCKSHDFIIKSTVEIDSHWEFENDSGSRDKRRKNNQIMDCSEQILECCDCKTKYEVVIAKGREDKKVLVYPQGAR